MFTPPHNYCKRLGAEITNAFNYFCLFFISFVLERGGPLLTDPNYTSRLGVMFSAGESGCIYQWNLATWAITHIMPGHKDHVLDIIYLDRTPYLGTASLDSTIR